MVLNQFGTINPVTPFTYRDNDTYLTVLAKLEATVNDLIQTVNDGHAELVTNFNTLVDSVNAINTLIDEKIAAQHTTDNTCLLYTSPSPRDRQKSRMPSSA